MTDSQATFKALGSYEIHSALVLECPRKLDAVSERNTARLVWFPGHSNILGNHVADYFAKIGSRAFPVASEPIGGVPYEVPSEEVRGQDSGTQNIGGEPLDSCIQKHYRIHPPAQGVTY